MLPFAVRLLTYVELVELYEIDLDPREIRFFSFETATDIDILRIGEKPFLVGFEIFSYLLKWYRTPYEYLIYYLRYRLVNIVLNSENVKSGTFNHSPGRKDFEKFLHLNVDSNIYIVIPKIIFLGLIFTEN